MTTTRVGVLSHDNSLVVDLSLRASGMSITGIEDPADLGGFDVALVDVPKFADPLELLMAIPPGPARVVLCHGPLTVVPEAGPGTIVERPCSLAEVLDAVRTAQQAPVAVGAGAPVAAPAPPDAGDRPDVEDAPHDDLVIVLDDAVPVTPAPTRLFTREGFSSPSRDAVDEHEESGEPEAGGEALFDRSLQGTEPETRTLTTVADEVALWALEREADLDRRSLGDRLAERIADVLEADNLVIWSSGDQGFAILGGFGITTAARDARIPVDHPVLRLAHGHDGLFLRTPEHAGARAPGFPGAGSDAYGVIVLPEAAHPAALLTAGAAVLPVGFAEGLRDLMVDVASLWPTD